MAAVCAKCNGTGWIWTWQRGHERRRLPCGCPAGYYGRQTKAGKAAIDRMKATTVLKGWRSSGLDPGGLLAAEGFQSTVRRCVNAGVPPIAINDLINSLGLAYDPATNMLRETTT
jgi:hypothetical protein